MVLLLRFYPVKTHTVLGLKDWRRDRDKTLRCDAGDEQKEYLISLPFHF